MESFLQPCTKETLLHLIFTNITFCTLHFFLYLLNIVVLHIENLRGFSVSTWAQMFSAKEQINGFQASLFFPHKPLERWLSFVQSFIIIYSPSEKFCLCLSHTDKFTKRPCSLVDSCAWDRYDEGSLKLRSWHIWSARDEEIGEHWIHKF